MENYISKDLDGLHDVILEVFDYDRPLSDVEVIYYWNFLPKHIKMTALEWGGGDTVFRDNAYEWFEKNKHVKLEDPTKCFDYLKEHFGNGFVLF